MLTHYNFMVIHEALQNQTSTPLFPLCQARAQWEQIKARLGASGVAQWVQRAEADATAEIPFLRATDYLRLKRTGDRQQYEAITEQRGMMLKNMTIAECLENEGRFLDPLLDVAWAICEESSWASPAHQVELADMAKPNFDLYAAMTATNLAEFDLLLGDCIEPALQKRIHDEIDRRLLTPYLSHHEWRWWMYNTSVRNVNNWNAVMNGCVIRAALLIEKDSYRLAEILARALHSLAAYVATFDTNGGSAEGAWYWSYGFGHYVMAADALWQRTTGKIDLFTENVIPQAAQFAARTILSHNTFAPFSDMARHTVLERPLLLYLGSKYDDENLIALAYQQPAESPRVLNSLCWTLRSLFWHVDEPQQPFTPNAHDWFPDMHWMFTRQNPTDPDALVLAIKGGHNGEPHNHNDVGSFVVHVKGEAVITDLGRGRYTRAYFEPNERYNHIVCQSHGHSVPEPNGYQQNTGEAYAAQVLDYSHTETHDSITYNLTAAYPQAADVEQLTRQVTLNRNVEVIELHDAITFAATAGTLETALITFGTVDLEENAVILQGERGQLRVAYDSQAVTVSVSVIDDVDLSDGLATIRRLAFQIKTPAMTSEIKLKIESYPNAQDA